PHLFSVGTGATGTSSQFFPIDPTPVSPGALNRVLIEHGFPIFFDGGPEAGATNSKWARHGFSFSWLRASRCRVRVRSAELKALRFPSAPPRSRRSTLRRLASRPYAGERNRRSSPAPLVHSRL